MDFVAVWKINKIKVRTSQVVELFSDALGSRFSTSRNSKTLISSHDGRRAFDLEKISRKEAGYLHDKKKLKEGRPHLVPTLQ